MRSSAGSVGAFPARTRRGCLLRARSHGRRIDEEAINNARSGKLIASKISKWYAWRFMPLVALDRAPSPRPSPAARRDRLQVDAGERIAIIGRNAPASRRAADSRGDLSRIRAGAAPARHSRRAMVQDVPLSTDRTVADVSRRPRHADGTRMAAASPGRHGMTRWSCHAAIVDSLSGGWKRRVRSPRAGWPADLLLLDEPTNHLDIEAITWLDPFRRVSRRRRVRDARSRVLDAWRPDVSSIAGA